MILQLHRLVADSRSLRKDSACFETNSVSGKEHYEQSELQWRYDKCHEELRKYLQKVEHIMEQLGSAAAEYYVSDTVDRLIQARDMLSVGLYGWGSIERQYFQELLRPFHKGAPKFDSDIAKLSPKAKQLLELLHSLQGRQVSTITFVDQRATAFILCRLLNAHLPEAQARSFVGVSQFAKRRAVLGDLMDASKQAGVMNDFRCGNCKIIVATSVCEEGMDIAMCNLVICFDKPQNIRSFIQRRGRARHRKSNYIVMLLNTDPWAKGKTWEELEKQMIEVYQQDRQRLNNSLLQESIDEVDDRRFVIESTG